jgi:hypothetical protein
MLAMAVSAALAMSASADELRGSLYQTLIQDAPQQHDVEMISYQQFNSMEQRLATMEARLASVETVGYAYQDSAAAATNGGCANGCGNGCGDSCGAGCGCNDSWCNTCCGCTFSAELLFLRGYNSEVTADNDTLESASRYEVGYMNSCGRSWRARVFEYENPDFANNDYLQLEYIDVEYAGRFTVGCNWRGELSAGFRWAQVDTENDNLYDDTLGPVLGLHMRGPCCYGLAPYANVRQSYQFGEEKDSDNFGNFAVSEVQLGLDWQTCACGGVAFARSFVEAQSWRGIDDQDDHADVGLFGFGFALGLTR